MPEIRTVAVIGAGIVGRGIAHRAALGGFRTILEDILPGSLRRAEAEIRTALLAAVARGSLDDASARAALDRIEFASSVEDAVREADLAVEAVPDELESKLEIFSMLDRMAPPRTLFATDTPTLSVADVASVTYRRSQCIGMRFHPPVHEMTAIEIVRTPETDPSALHAVLDACRRMDLRPVQVDDAPLQPTVHARHATPPDPYDRSGEGA